MILWQTEKRWTYKGRNCEIQRTNVGDAAQFRGLVEVRTDVSDRALDAAPVADPCRKRRPKRREKGEYRIWVCFNWSGDEFAGLREVVNELAEYVAETEI